MCQSKSNSLSVASNQDVHQDHENKTTAMNTAGELIDDVAPSHPPSATGVSAPLPSAALPPFDDEYRFYDDDTHCFINDDGNYAGEDDDEHRFNEDDHNAGGEYDGGLHDDDAPPLEQQQQQAPSKAAAAYTFSRAKLAELREKLAGVDRASAVVAGLSLVGGAVGAYFLFPAAAGVGAAAATMKAPGAAGFVISRAAFLANPQLYFQLLRTAGAAAAAAAFAVAV